MGVDIDCVSAATVVHVCVGTVARLFARALMTGVRGFSHFLSFPVILSCYPNYVPSVYD